MGHILSPALDSIRAFNVKSDAQNRAALASGQERFETAPAYAGDDDSIDIHTATDAVTEVLGRACRTFDKQAARDLLREAAGMLETLADEVESGEVTL